MLENRNWYFIIFLTVSIILFEKRISTLSDSVFNKEFGWIEKILTLAIDFQPLEVNEHCYSYTTGAGSSCDV
ncbi:hypothetical protein DQM68_10220 [Leptospira mayottensis]|uniref:Uncharacterized protein n=1 Tax=Leptospira mayottensis TaxID=1137606 RepID=A0ABN5NZB2_9LEPT|nr:hypothetical protein DQM68_10220 [Leptospira mayottensis]AXR65737.1 hypothetical protein DQM28_17525 [Leptospira mayottensis]AXR68561.1 hypothetical protein DPV73_11595 [Leptospira mayottensis]TGM96880.1 DUF3641 domain-containing protein [Leptospira mayottensis]